MPQNMKLQFVRKFLHNNIHLRIFLLMACDIAWSVLVFSAIMYGYWLLEGFRLRYYWALLPFSLLFVICNSFSRCYHGRFFTPGIALNKIEEIRRLTLSLLMTYLLLFSWLMFSRTLNHYSRFVLLLSMIVTCVTLPIARFAVRWVMKKLNIGQTNVLIVGAGETGRYIGKELAGSCYYGFRAVGFLDDKCTETDEKLPPVLGTLNNAKTIARKYHVSHIICCLPITVMEPVFRRFSRTFRHMIFIPSRDILPISWAYAASIGLFGGFEICNQQLLLSRLLWKKLVEYLLSICIILFILPLLLVLGVLVKISSPGPVFYRASRLGYRGKPIQVLKFRTMHADADAQLERLLEENPELKQEWQEKYKITNDPRITGIGRFLRRTSLDELPQFLNVLKGDMAIVGPRPIVRNEIGYYGKNYELLKRVKPGITGLWQVSGRSETSYRYRVTLDMYYITNWSIWMDYYILFKTVLIVLARRGAC